MEPETPNQARRAAAAPGWRCEGHPGPLARTAVRRVGWTEAEIEQMEADRHNEAEWQEKRGDRILEAFQRGE